MRMVYIMLKTATKTIQILSYKGDVLASVHFLKFPPPPYWNCEHPQNAVPPIHAGKV